MAIYNFKYRDVKFEMMEEFIKWYQNTLNLRDWQITIEASDECPKEFKWLGRDNPGACRTYTANMVAKVWVSPQMCKSQNRHPLEILSHEMCHVLLAVVMIDSNDEDPLIYRIQGIILEKFCKEYKLRLGKSKDPV